VTDDLVRHTMQAEAKRKERIAALHQEMDSAHDADSLYWQQTLRNSDAARAAYYRRQDRLEEIRAELEMLRK
jgi:hypothetical protein